MDDITKAYAWQEAIQLSKQLVRVCEEFSDADSNVLVWHLRQAVVEVPAGIAADLQAKRKATMEPTVKLATALELVRRIYPGIETGDAEERLEKLMQRLASPAFNERESEPETEPDDETLDNAKSASVTNKGAKSSNVTGQPVDGVSQSSTIAVDTGSSGSTPAQDQD